MLSSDKRAILTSGLLAAKEQEQAHASDDAAASAPPSASLFSLPRSGARQRLIAGAARAAETADGDSSPAEVAAPAPPEPAPSEPSEPVLYSKGDASASGFRPWYWSYERDGDPGDGAAGRVARFPAAAAAPVAAAPEPAAAPPEAASPAPAAKPQRGTNLGFVLLAGFSAAALLTAAVLFVLSRNAPTLPPSAPPSAGAETVIARTLPLASPVPAPVRPTKVAPLPSGAASRSADAAPAADVVELMARGDQLLATGDIVAARLFYERAAERGSAAAARQAGKTYDPLFLAENNARGLRADPVAAARWYRRASAGGDRQADALMARLMAKFAR